MVRATEDVDIFVNPTPLNVARLRAALTAIWPDPEIVNITVEDLAGDYPAVRYAPPDGQLSIDILARLGSAFAFADIESEDIEYAGTTIRVATPRMLYRMKHDTVRLQDKVDAANLRRQFDLGDDDAG